MIKTSPRRAVRRILTTAAIGAVAATCLASGAAVPSAAGHAGRTGGHAVDTAVPGASTPLELAAVSAYPALSRASYEAGVLAEINRVRGRHHLGRVTLAACPQRVATRWSVHLATSDTFVHQSMTRLLVTCSARYSGEVLGRGSVSPRTLVTMWMNSAPHRHILMSSAPHRIGIGATPNSRGEWVVAANFMSF
jgi:uncharacterized protein YkwD